MTCLAQVSGAQVVLKVNWVIAWKLNSNIEPGTYEFDKPSVDWESGIAMQYRNDVEGRSIAQIPGKYLLEIDRKLITSSYSF